MPVFQMVSFFPLFRPIGVCITHVYHVSRDSIVDKATGYGLDGRGVGVRVPVGLTIFSSPRRPDRLWGPPLLSDGNQGKANGT
jgi:hypothetical protein